MEDKNILLSIKNLNVKFRVRGRVLSAIRNVSLDIFENETIAIVGESGCGKSVLTKTFAGMLDNNGFIDQGSIVFNDEELTAISAPLNPAVKALIAQTEHRLNGYSKLELSCGTYRELIALEKDRQSRLTLSDEAETDFEAKRRELIFERTEANNRRLTLDTMKEKAEIHELSKQIDDCDEKLKALEAQKKQTIREDVRRTRRDGAYNADYRARHAELKARYAVECTAEISDETRVRNKRLAKDVYLSVSRYPAHKQAGLLRTIMRSFKKAMQLGVDLSDDALLDAIFETAVFHVRLTDETHDRLNGHMTLNLAKTSCVNNWTNIRGNKIATIFQDPMTSLNPILTIGNQITSVIIKHQHVSEFEARKRAITLMQKVGIPNAENRFDDYPFQYSGGMRQRIVIAIALSCRPKILICDEPTTALDVTIQAQILQLIKDLQKELHYTTVFITHDLGVVANVADRVAVLYAGEIVEIGTVDEVFYDPRHPYTWVLLSSLPQLSDKNSMLYSIAGTPPSLYNRITGDAFAPRNPYCLKVDTLKAPPMFKISETHYAKTWLLDPRAPKIDKPAIICDISTTLKKAFNI